ncbi:MAG: hypothetical protein RLN62_01360 [Rickettsiales bacterium]
MSMRKSLEETLKSLINNTKISTHQEILDYLKHHYKIEITQSTLSRKLNKCFIEKVDGFYRLNPMKKNSTKNISFLLSEPNLIIVTTPPGHANAVAYQIDMERLNSADILGTVAGDDTIFVACDGVTKLEKITSRIKNSLGLISS